MSVNMLIFISTIVMLWTTVGAVVTELTLSGAWPVKENETLTLTCKANCANSCSYLWTGPDGSSANPLTFSAKRRHRNKIFTCRVTDSFDNDTKQSDTYFDVYYGPDSVTISPSGSMTIIEGEQSDTNQVTCTKPECNPPCNITWQGPGPVSPTTTSPTSNLFLSNHQIKRNHAGTYTCTILNTYTSQTQTASRAIIVNYAPVVTPKWLMDTGSLECTAVGVPNTYTFKSIKHYVNRTLVRELPVNATGGKGIASITNKNFQDTGVYKCFVNNNITHYINKQLDQEGAVTVNISDKPQIIPTNKTYNASKNDPLDVIIMVYAIPCVDNVSFLAENTSVTYSNVTFNESSVTLAFHRKNVTTTGQMIHVHFNRVLEEYFTIMTVYVSNDEGNATVSITILPQGAPDIPYNFTIVSLSHDRVITSIRTGFFNGASQTLVPQYKEPGNDTNWINGTSVNCGSVRDQFFQFEITGLKPETMYVFRVFSYNDFGRSDYSPVLQQLTDKAPVSAGVIVGATLGGFAAVIIVAVLIFLVRRRKLKQAQAKTSHTAKNSDLEVNMPTTPTHDDHASNEYTPEPKAPNSDLYENTRFKKTKTKTDNNGKESDYYNTKIKATPTTVVYRKSEDKLDEQAQAIPPYLELANNDPVEEAYFNVDISNNTANMTITGTPVPERQQSEEPYENTDISGSKEKKDYVNVEQYRKNKDTPVQDTPVTEEGLYLEMNLQPATTKKNNDKDITKRNKDKDTTKKNKDKDKKNRKNKTTEEVKLSHQDSTGSKELYVDMHKPDRQSVTSVPEYTAPPPPESLAPLEEEQYINFRFGTKK